MISRRAAAEGPYTVIDCETGRTSTWDDLQSATEYAGRLLNVFGRVSATYSSAGQLVGSTETLIDGGIGGDAG